MRNHMTTITLAIFGLVALAVVAGPLGAAPQATGGFAIIDNARVFDESNQGRAATQSIQANVDSWQQQLVSVDTEGILRQAVSHDTTGARRRELRKLLFDAIGVEDGGGLLPTRTVVWKGTKRTVDVVFGNLADTGDISDTSPPKNGATTKSSPSTSPLSSTGGGSMSSNRTELATPL